MNTKIGGLEKASSAPELVADEDILQVIELSETRRERSSVAPAARVPWYLRLRRALTSIGVVASLLLTGWLLLVLTTGMPLARPQQGIDNASAIINPMLVLEPIEIEIDGSSGAERDAVSGQQQ